MSTNELTPRLGDAEDLNGTDSPRRLAMIRALARLAAAASLLALTAASAFAADKVSVAAISGYFGQGFGVSIVNGLNKAKDEFGIDLKLVDTGNRALDYEEQFNN